MTVENVKMDVCQQAMQIADEKGNDNGILDENEFSIFAKEAIERGAAPSAVEAVCNKELLRSNEDADNTIKKLKTLNAKTKQERSRTEIGAFIGMAAGFIPSLIAYDSWRVPKLLACLLFALLVPGGTFAGYKIVENSAKSKQLKEEINQIKADMGVEIKESA